MQLSTARRLAPLALVAALLTGCSWQSLGMSRPTESAATSHPAPASATPKASTPAGSKPTTTPTTASTTVRHVGGGLSGGSTVHRVAVGSRSLVITYWTTRNVSTWTSSQTAPVQISARINGSDRERVYVTGFRATFAPAGGAARTLDTDTGRFVISARYSYAGAVVVPAMSSHTSSAQLQVQFDLLVETTPGSGQYYRQTAIDSVPFTYSTAGNPS
jgi:hypothetical protein